MEYEKSQHVKRKEMRTLDIKTDFDLQNAQYDWIKGSPLFSHEQKMYVAIDDDTAAKQKAIQDRMNALRTEMVETGDKMGMTSDEKDDLNKKICRETSGQLQASESRI
jgi:hypothetical protein